MKKELLFIACFGLAISSNSIAQQSTTRTCGTRLPGPEWDAWFNGKVEEFKTDVATNRAQAAAYTIPIIVHVIHGGEAIGTYPNLSNAQLVSEIQILNDDYAGIGVSTQNIPAVFQPALADCGIKFCLATKDPNGRILTEPGVDRINYKTNNWQNPESVSNDSFMDYVDNTIKIATIWDPTKYLNIWVTSAGSGGLLGYATFPAGTNLTGISATGNSASDGVWCNSKAYGNVGTLMPKYDLGRSATHEIGHWLGLRHIWGDGSCATDYCNDTPPAKTSNGGVPTHPHNYPGGCAGNTTGEMFMNFMDYSDDIAMSMFTNDQKARMQTTMLQGTYRKVLGTHGLCSSADVKEAQEELNANVLLYPNPSTGSLRFSTSFSDGRSLTIVVRNLLGQTVYSQPYKTSTGLTTIDLGGVAKGIYTITISEANGSVTRKLILE